MTAIGGYFSLELDHQTELHPHAIKVNSGRNALEYILKVNNYDRIFIPYYTCPVILEPLNRLNVNYVYYHIDNNLSPVEIPPLFSSDALLYINYFGIKQDVISHLIGSYENLIIDNSQAYFSDPITGIDTFYSPRKFFGVPDGGLVYTAKGVLNSLKQSSSYDRCDHLLKRIDLSAEDGYMAFEKNEERIAFEPLSRMSSLTDRLLKSIIYDTVKFKRNQNFHYLHEKLNKYNELKIDFSDLTAPLTYPFLLNDSTLRQYLLENRIYIPCYWKEVIESDGANEWERFLSVNLLALPVDQRYQREEMDFIINKLKFKL